MSDEPRYTLREALHLFADFVADEIERRGKPRRVGQRPPARPRVEPNPEDLSWARDQLKKAVGEK